MSAVRRCGVAAHVTRRRTITSTNFAGDAVARLHLRGLVVFSIRNSFDRSPCDVQLPIRVGERFRDFRVFCGR